MTHNESERAGLAGPVLRRVLLIWAIVAAIELAINAVPIAEVRFPDPDDTLRLLQVRDWLAGQSWFDVHQYRIDPPGGVAMHWTRLVDLPIGAAIISVRWLVGQPTAELIALVVVPIVTLGCAMLLIGRIAWKLFDKEVAGLACLACALAVPVIHQLRPLRIDHHGWQIVAALGAINGLMARDPRRGGWVVGGSLAAGLAISIEGLPFAAAVVAVTALRWLRNPAERRWILHTMQALAGSSIGLFLLTRALGDLAQHCDAISPAHLEILAWCAAVIAAAALIRSSSRATIVGALAVAAGGALVILATAAPQCLAGPFAGLDPLVRSFWLDGVLAGRPLWHDSVSALLQGMALPLVGLAATWQLARRASGGLRWWWIEYGLLLLCATLVGLLVARAAGAACALAAVPVGWQLREWMRASRATTRPRQRALAFGGIALALAPAAPLSLLAVASPGHAAPRQGALTEHVSNCKMDEAAPALAALPRGEILAPLDIGPRLLYLTPHTVLATGHHRAARAMHEVIAAFLGSSDEAHALVRLRRIGYVAICPDLIEPHLYIAQAPHGFAAQLVDGQVPTWLQSVVARPGASFRVWRVVG